MSVGFTKIGEQYKHKVTGQMMTVIAYRNNKDVTVRFDDGVIAVHKRYQHFRQGEIQRPTEHNPNWDKIGEINQSVHGPKMVILDYRNPNDIDVLFESGEIANNQTYKDFQVGTIDVPTNSKIGETSRSNCGLLMKIIRYHNASDVDIQFEDGEIIKNKQYGAFRRGEILHPTNHSHYWQKSLTAKNAETKVGETHLATNGQVMTIIRYGSNIDLDVQFEDGTIVPNRQYSNFVTGNIRNPNLSVRTVEAQKRNIGKEVMTNYGLKMKIIDYHGARNLDVQLEDGRIVKHISISGFRRGYCARSLLPYTIGDVTMKKLAYVYNNTGNFYCTCSKCGMSDIMDLEEVRNHKC